jgi:hypothetical protein
VNGIPYAFPPNIENYTLRGKIDIKKLDQMLKHMYNSNVGYTGLAVT